MTTEQQAFVHLLKAGLWGHLDEPAIAFFRSQRPDWQEVYTLAQQQTSVGIMTDGMTLLPTDLRPPKQIYFNCVAQTGTYEVDNRQLSQFARELQQRLKQKGVDTLLLKGQGVAQLYRQPLHRQMGDIDILINDSQQLVLAQKLMQRIADTENISSSGQHSEFTVGDNIIELHGEFGFTICPKTTRNLRLWAGQRLQEPPQTVAGFIVPNAAFNAVFVFAHMLNHYMIGGVGLRQVSDWMRLMHHITSTRPQPSFWRTLREDLNLLGLTRFWHLFAVMAVQLLGCPAESMPFIEQSLTDDNLRKSHILLDNIFKTGNFGALQKEKQLAPSSTNKWVKKVHTAFGELPVYFRTARLFPRDAVYCFFKYAKGQLK